MDLSVGVDVDENEHLRRPVLEPPGADTRT
jgi:hypothetical protein